MLALRASQPCLPDSLPAGFQLGSTNGRPRQEWKAGGEETSSLLSAPIFVAPAAVVSFSPTLQQHPWCSLHKLCHASSKALAAAQLCAHCSQSTITWLSSWTEHPQAKLCPPSSGDKPWGISSSGVPAPNVQHSSSEVWHQLHGAPLPETGALFWPSRI